MINEIEELNQNQKNAVLDINHPCRIIAGPGSGKTRVITLKYLNLILEQKIPIENILLLTFSNKATEEMISRVYNLFSKYKIQSDYSKTNISTIHAFCLSVLERYANMFKCKYNATQVLTEVTQGCFILSFIEDYGFFSKAQAVRPVYEEIIPFINKVTDEGLTSDDIYNHLTQLITFLFDEYDPKKDHSELDKELKRVRDLIIYNSILEEYQSFIKEHRYIDYSHMQYLLYMELKSNKKLVDMLRTQYTHLLVDEYQDISYLQNEIILNLAAPKYNLTIVGDDDQSIYRFRGATVKNFLDFSKRLPNTADYYLDLNYRSTMSVNKICQNVIKNNMIRIEKNIYTLNEAKIDSLLLSFKDSYEEAQKLTQFIKSIYERKCIQSYSDIAILFRSVTHDSTDFLNALRSLNIPYKIHGIDKIRTSYILGSFLNLWEFISGNISDIQNVLENELLGLSNIEKENLRKIGKRNAKIENVPRYLSRDSKGYKLFLTLIDMRINIKKFKSNIDVFYSLMLSIPHITRLLKDEAWEMLGELGYFSQIVSDFDSTYKRTDPFLLSIVLRNIIIRGEDIIETTEQHGKVNILTIHQAKGLEFPIVFMPNQFHHRYERSPFALLYDIFHYEGRDEETLTDMDERKLFYVGMSRAKYAITISHPNEIQQTKRRIRCRACRYIEETGLEYIKALTDTKLIEDLRKLDLVKEDEKPYKEKLVLSFSRIQTYMDCPRKYHYMYNLRFATKQLGQFYFGQSLHRSLESMHRILKQEPKTEFSIDDIRKIIDLNWIEISYRKKDTEPLKNHASVYLWNYFLSNRDLFDKIVDIEYKFNYDFSDSVLFTGKIDLIVRNNGIEIIDFKTDEIELPRYALQIYFYGYSLDKATHIKSDRITLFSLKQNKKKTTMIDSDKMIGYIKNIESIIYDITNKNFTQNKGDACKACPYNDLC